MKKILSFIFGIIVCFDIADAAERGENTVIRGKTTNVVTNSKTARSVQSRQATNPVVKPRAAKSVSVLTPRNTTNNVQTRSATRTSTTQKNISARAAATAQTTKTSETKIGAAYEQCKTAFFTCMDQFCELKNDSYRRCSCSDRIFDFQEISSVYQQANEKLTEFSEKLDVVGMSKEQAIAMKTASEGEDALTEDKSASKQLLQAIMNSIKGGDTNVGGKYQALNSVNIGSDTANAFGMDDSGQIIASYNGSTLYKAVYPKCKNAVKEDCNNASLQRAINAYLMLIEQDCNTVETALKQQQKTLNASTHQSSAMLDLARVENRQKHNSDEISTCLNNVEQAILSEEVCGSGYHKCLDYGQFIDISTGAPITGVTDFYKLADLLTFNSSKDIQDQKLSTIQNNKTFVQFFENKTKKFAKESLDKCTENADFVWSQYLDKALIDIHYAQQDKVKVIKESCVDLVSECYDNQGTSIANAMANLTGDSTILLKPKSIALTTEMCSKYIDSCGSMFNNNIIREYVANKDSNDTITACRAVAQNCFDSFGGSGYNLFYFTQSGLFKPGEALDWFTLYEKTTDENGEQQDKIVSSCAQQLASIQECKANLEKVFGGFDRHIKDTSIIYAYTNNNDNPVNRTIRPSGIATEVYYKILDNLKTSCNNLGGYFVEQKYAVEYGYKSDDFCRIDSANDNSNFAINKSSRKLNYWYHFIPEENMCPSNYGINVDTQSWGMCSCWENGGRRSKNGTIATCRPLLPSISENNSSEEENLCSESNLLCSEENECSNGNRAASASTSWCQQTIFSNSGQVCPTMNLDDNFECILSTETDSEQPQVAPAPRR